MFMPKKPVINIYNNIKAEDLFTDREEPRKAFWNAYDNMVKGAVEIITYYGVGGIGKTSLLRQLCREFREKIGENKVPNYAFFSFEGSPTKKEFLLSLSRQMMLYNKKLTFPLFDTALAKISDGKDLDKFIEGKKKSFMENRVVDVAVSIGGQFVPGLESAAKVVDLIWGLMDNKTAQKACKTGNKQILYNEIQNPEKIDNVKNNLHKYFLEDVYEVMEKNDKPYVVFIDGYENYVSLIEDGNLSEGTDNWISQELVGIPNVLWVISGREKLKWDVELLPNENQHRMGDLSELDVNGFFRKAGIEDEELVKSLYKLTNGTPVYLDLCAKTYYEIIKDKKPEIEDFGKDTGELVKSYFKKMGVEDQKIMVMLSFLPRVWDIDMAEQVAKSLGYEAYWDNIHKLIKLSIFERVDIGIKIHETTRIVIRDAHRDKQERIANAVIQYLVGILLEYKDSMGYMNSCVQFVETMELCDTKVVSNENMQQILYNINAESFIGAEYIKTEYVLSLLDSILEKMEYSCENIALCKGCRCINLEVLGRYNEALELAKRTLEYTESHPDIDLYYAIKSYALMGDIKLEMGEYQEALEYLTRALMMKLEKKYELGKDIRDLDVFDIMINIANVYRCMGQFEIALDKMEKTYENVKELFGEENFIAMGVLDEVASIYQELGEFDKAKERRERAYGVIKKKFGEEHPHTFHVLNGLGNTYIGMKEYEKAKKIYERVSKKVYEEMEKLLGKYHKEVLVALSNRACIYYALGEYEEAKNLYEQLCEARSATLGKNNPTTLEAEGILADINEMLKGDFN